MLCFKLYNSRDASIHNTAGVAIRQVVSAMFERLNTHMKEEEEGEDEDVGKGGKGSGSEMHKQLPTQARDAYLLFQVRDAIITLSHPAFHCFKYEFVCKWRLRVLVLFLDPQYGTCTATVGLAGGLGMRLGESGNETWEVWE